MDTEKNSDFNKFQSEVLPYYESGSAGTLSGQGQVALTFRSFIVKNERAALVLLPGRGEPLFKYAEVIYDLRGLGFSIYILEHRGQGESGLVDGVRYQYVQSYDDYVRDLDTFVQTVVRPQSRSKLFLLGHSMGGAISALYGAQHPGVFDALVLSAPMFDINTRPYSKKTARGLAQFMCKMGFGKWSAAKDSNPVTSSEVRNERGIQAADKYSKGEWRKISYRWVLASLEAVDAVQERSQALTLPILLLQAEKDLHVPAEGQDQFSKKIRQCEKVVIRNSLHEILMETDSIRNIALAKIVEFLTLQLEN